ncbi:hypothetical protein ACFS5N_09250 [Mucilaginibacter ximonensis]|uniref:Uncharacterized protein n=1 Tax=Mucilaginibacter ximonensis TaxID=538021 RepID=A0ABW5YBA4_9SPHI
MEVNDSIFRCFMKIGFDPNLIEEDFADLDKTFSPYIWGANKVDAKLKKLKYVDYGDDLRLILLQFYVKPTLIELNSIKDIESYRKNEKSIGIPIIVDNENFFSKSEEVRCIFLKQSILQKLDLLENVVKKKKLDTNIEQLKIDLQNILN